MIRMPLSEMVGKIGQKTGLSEADVLAKIEDKCKSLSGLISKEGAAHIVANELGVKLVESSGKIKDLYPGMRSVDIVGRITNVYEVREFSRADGTNGKVGSFVLGDETGTMRMVCWGNKTDIIDTLSEGSVVKVTATQVRENNRGFKECHLTDQSQVEVDNAQIGEVKRNSAARISLKDLKEDGQYVEVLGTVVQVFDPRFFEVCPDCGGRLKEHEGQWFCDQHSAVAPDYSYLVNVYVDDGTENIRVVLFRAQAEQLLNKSKEEMISFRTNPDSFEPLKTELLGEQFRFIGRGKHNKFFDRLEFVANKVYKAEAEEELKRIQ
ncbi:hypothetical protein KY329_05130 [Candidatus Woesearchaeota archaeon]|nr:hypothetical protein [Candidatus Woesearchaeota archaeon]